VFGLSQGTLESLVDAVERFDFAVIVLTADDVIIMRETRTQTPRDNVMFELGLFMGAIGRGRTFVVCPNTPGLTLPSDLGVV
jgi:predicted nucleotide-binding protein